MLSGYSTIPVAPAAFNFGMTSRTTASSRIVFTATQFGSLKCEIVGKFNAGNSATIASSFSFGAFIISPTRPCAAIAAFSISEMFSIFCRFQPSTQAVLFDAANLTPGDHTLQIVVDGTHATGSTGTFVSVDAIDLPPAPVSGGAVYPTVPQQPGTAITLNGRDSHILPADLKIGQQQLQYSTSELMTDATIAGSDIAVLYGDKGTDGETVLRYATQPSVQSSGGTVSAQLLDAHTVSLTFSNLSFANDFGSFTAQISAVVRYTREVL